MGVCRKSMNLEIKHFKALLNDYTYIVSKLTRVKEARLDLETKRGVHAVRYDRVPSGGNPLLRELQRLDGVEKNAFLEKLEAQYQSELDEIMGFITYSPVGSSVFKIYCTGESTYKEEAAGLYMDVTNLKRKVNREIETYINR